MPDYDDNSWMFDVQTWTDLDGDVLLRLEDSRMPVRDYWLRLWVEAAKHKEKK